MLPMGRNGANAQGPFDNPGSILEVSERIGVVKQTLRPAS